MHQPAQAARRAESTVGAIRTTGVVAMTLGLISALALPYVLWMNVDESWSHDTPTSVWLTVLWSAAVAGLSVLELAGGIGALALRRWSRPALLVYAWAMLALGLLAVPLFVPWFRPVQWSTALYDRPAPANYDVLAEIPLAAWVAGTPFAIFLILFLLRRTVKDAYLRLRNDGDGSSEPSST